MYQLDPNINTALERQAERLRDVNATSTRQFNPVTTTATVALAVAAPIVLAVVWVLAVH